MRSYLKTFAVATVMFMAFANSAVSQKLLGVVVQKNDEGVDEAVAGANVFWIGTSNAVATGKNGVFMIDRVEGKNLLVVSFIGLRSDTLEITDQTNVKVELKPMQLKEVTVEGWRSSLVMDQSRTVNTTVMMEKELFKAACCNLSESFETNPSVDVAFTDALTGTRQIQMLGLSGPNTMISIENMPGVRGLASSQGIQLIPGTWINSIEVTKGVGPVVNGYESIAGQINVELKKPQDSEKLYLNGYVNQSARSELNLNYSTVTGKKWATTFLLHGSMRPLKMDQNNDMFLDFPTGSQVNVVNRWVYNSGNGWLGQFGIKVLRDRKLGGQEDFDPDMDKFSTHHYGLEINTNRTELWGKLGYQFPDKPYKSIGLQLSGTQHDHDSYYGLTTHRATEKSGYANLIYQSIIGSTQHKFKTGLSFLYDDFDERLLTGLQEMLIVKDGVTTPISLINFDRKEVVPGAFLEYTYDYLDKFSVVAGIRIDQHNLFGTIVTPRIHTKWNVTETTSLRFSAGKGTRVANMLIENTGVLASSRQLVFTGFQSSKAYGYKPDVAWNYGVNFSQDFTFNYRPGTITFDYFYTNFKNQLVLDVDQSVRQAMFYGLSGKSFSHSLQAQLDYQPVRRFDVRLAYRYLDVRTDFRPGLLARPLISKHRAFLNLAYETKNKWKFDYTIQWLGKQRLPYTTENPEAFQLPAYSPSYVLMNAQLSKDLRTRWNVYVGIENITNYKLANPIVSAAEPFSPYFDSSMVWGPVFGRMAYAGFRYRVK